MTDNQTMRPGASAFITIVGRPNVGKSSILNRLVGKKIAIVSKKPQTTRNRIMGVVTKDNVQLVFIDTPGLTLAKNALGSFMVKSVEQSVLGVDACLLVVEAGRDISKADRELIERFKQQNIPAMLVINKIDLLADKTALMKQIDEYMKLFPFSAVIPVSARDGSGMQALEKELMSVAGEDGFLFPEDTLTDQTERVIVSEIVREKLLRLLNQEIPHGIAVVTESMKERGQILDLEVTIYCERANHKGIIIGKGGSMLKKIGIAAREDIERFFECKANLQLWVKVKEDWRQRPETLQTLGFNQKDLLS